MSSRDAYLSSFRRRDFAKLAGGCAALTNTSLLSTLFNLSATNSVVAANDLTGYKAIVCLFLFGGNDSFNMLSPQEPSERADYLAARGGVAGVDDGALGLPAAGLHEVTDLNSTRRFNIHPSMPEMKTLFNAGKLSFVSNVGSLVEPTDMQQYQSRTNLPLGLFSHSDLQRHWMTSVPQTRSQLTGWAGRMADLVTGATNSNENVSMNMTLDNINMLQTGGAVIPYVVSRNGASTIQNYNRSWHRETIYRTLNEDALSRSYDNLVERTFAGMNSNAIAAADEFNLATTYADPSDTDAPDPLDAFFGSSPSRLGENLRMVARCIRGQGTLGQQRQCFFVSQGGFDNHDELITNQSNNLVEVSQALKGFQDAVDSLGETNNVLLFTASDFARTLNSNGRGSDHAWGGNQIVMGGPVSGGRVFGDYPTSLAPGNPLDLGRGRLLPTTSVDEMACEIANWYGVENDNQMENILPNIRNFVNAGVDRPLGFLN